MRHLSFFLLLATLATARPLHAQQSKGDVTVTVDNFTRDSIWTTKYGRLDEAKGCARTSLSHILILQRGPRRRIEKLQFEYYDSPSAFHPPQALEATGGGLNIDGKIVSLSLDPLYQHVKTLLDGPRDFHENGSFILPDSAFESLVSAKEVRLRITGADKLCDGILEPNMLARLRELLSLSK